MARKNLIQQAHHHRLRKLTDGHQTIWRCMDCKFMVYLKQKLVMIGQKCVCWECDTHFLFTEEHWIDEDLVKCASCNNPLDVDSFQKNHEIKIKEGKELLYKEMDRLREEMTGDIDDDLLMQIAQQNLAGRDI